MYTVWTNTMTVAYKTRPEFNPRTGLTGGTEEYLEETAYWFPPQAIVVGLTAEQARDVRLALERATELSPIAGDDVKATARKLALSRKEDVVIQTFWVTLDGVDSLEASDASNIKLRTYGECG